MEYISREDALKAICEYCQDNGTCGDGNRCAEYANIKAIPTADAVPVRHGKWEWNEGENSIVCSICGEKSPHVYPFCPWCGAQNGNP